MKSLFLLCMLGAVYSQQTCEWLHPFCETFVQSNQCALAHNSNYLTQLVESHGNVQEASDIDIPALIKNVTDKEFFLVLFYSPSCAFSSQLKPIYRLVAKAFPTLLMLSVDATKYENVNYRYSIYGLPKIMLFRTGSETYAPKRYQGAKNFKAISNFVSTHTGLLPEKVEEPETPPALQQGLQVDIYLLLSSSITLGYLIKYLLDYLEISLCISLRR